MKLDKHVVDMFTELTKPADDVKMEKTCYGTISVVDGTRYVKLDGSDLLVPAASTVKTSHGDRVTVLMKNHSLTVTGNLTAPATDGEGGSSGEAGTAATIEVGTVTTGEAGSSAAVTNSGTTSAAVFDFVIPRGDKGEKGDTGPQGPRGEKGDTGTWDGTIPDHEHTVSDITDFPTSLPANGGNADKLDGKHAESFMQWLDYIIDVDFLNNANYKVDYHGNISDGALIGLPIAGWYHIVYYMHANINGYGMQIAYPLNFDGATMIRRANGTTWGTWKNVADGGNADTLDGKHADEFLYANGFAGQLAKLFSQPANDDALATVFSVAPDNATLDTLNPGIYVVNTSAARKSLKIPNETIMGGPNGATVDNSQCVGGILIKLGSILGKPGIYAAMGGTAVDRPYTTSCAFFISNNGSIYRAIESIHQSAGQTGVFTYAEWTWRAFVFDSFNNANDYTIQSIVYINSDVTLAPGKSYTMYHTKGMFALPYTSGSAYGPTKWFPLRRSGNDPDLCIVNTSSTKKLIIPAGRYLIHAK